MLTSTASPGPPRKGKIDTVGLLLSYLHTPSHAATCFCFLTLRYLLLGYWAQTAAWIVGRLQRFVSFFHLDISYL